MKEQINITTIWGWTWTFNVLTWLKKNSNYNLAAVVSMSDSWWSTWVLRDEFWILPPGDIRRAVLALSKEWMMFRQLFEYRFDKKSSVSWHTVWNLLLTAMADIKWDFELWLQEVCKMFRVKWKVIPVTNQKSDLWVELENWQKIIWETNIDCPIHDPNLKITNAFLVPEVNANPRAKDVIENSDIIIIGPGDLYTSIIPNLLVDGISESIKNSKAKVVYFCNIMTKFWETTNFEVNDFVDVIEKYLWKDVIDYVVVNNWHISDEMIEKYKNEENKKPVKVKDISLFKDKNYKIVWRDLLNEKDYVRHSSEKLAWVIWDIVDWWIK